MTEKPELRTDVPAGWGEDDLSKFIHDAYRNRLATFANQLSDFERLKRIDWCFLTVAKGWINPRDMISPLLFLRSHAAFRASCEMALSGQAGELYSQLRACLERAGYCLLLGKKTDLGEVWLNRHRDQEAMKRSKIEFEIRNVRQCLEEVDRDGAGRYGDLYQFCIDFGGHPNERSVTGNMKKVEMEDRLEFQQVYMHGAGVELTNALITTARVGLCALETMQNLYLARYELLGVREAILDLRRGL